MPQAALQSEFRQIGDFTKHAVRAFFALVASSCMVKVILNRLGGRAVNSKIVMILVIIVVLLVLDYPAF